MNTAEQLAATFAEHEPEAPDVTETRLGIEAELARGRRRPPLTALAAVGATAAVVLLVAYAATFLGGEHPRTGGHSAADSSTVRPASPARSRTPTPQPTDFAFRPGYLPPGASFDHAEVGLGTYRLQDYTFGSVPSQQRGLTIWSDDDPLPVRLRDGGTLHPVIVRGRPGVRGWSPSSRSYTIAVSRPHHLLITVFAYGWDRATAKTIAMHTAGGMQYGRFPEPQK